MNRQAQIFELQVAQYGQSRRMPERFDADDEQAALMLDVQLEDELFLGALRDALDGDGAPLPTALRRL